MNQLLEDYNLLPALQALLTEKHISRAAARFGVTQSAMSRIFLRLKEQFDDPLLIRVGRQYEMTDRAKMLLPAVNAILFQTDLLLQPNDLDLKTVNKTITLSGADMDVTLLCSNIQAILKFAPNLFLSVNSSTLEVTDSVLYGNIDYAITPVNDERSGLYRRQWLSDDYVAVVDKNWRISQKKFTLDYYLNQDHAAFSLTKQKRANIDEALLSIGEGQRRVKLFLPTFEQVPSFIIGSELIFSLPRSFAEFLKKRYPIRLLELPFHIPTFKLYLYWHERIHRSALHQWFRKEILKGFVK